MQPMFEIECPYCGHGFSSQAALVTQCPVCDEQFFASSDQGEPLILEYDSGNQFRETPERLDQRRIRSVQLEKRALYRSRTYMIVLAIASVCVAAQLVWMAVQKWRGQEVGRAVAEIVVAAGLCIFSVRFFQRAKVFRKKAAQSDLAEPINAPDFKPLSDGRQIAAQLTAMTDRRSADE